MATTRFFLSYSRRDTGVAGQLIGLLEARGHEVFRDTTGIPYGAEWREWIRTEIGRADSVVFLVSAEWIGSRNCREELDIAVEDRKRRLPVSLGIKAEVMPAALASVQLISVSDDTGSIAAAAAQLEAAAQTDPGWVLQHRRLLQEAKDWHAASRRRNLLLARAALRSLDDALTVRERPDPPLNPLQMDYVAASRKELERRRFLAWGAVSVTAMVVVAMLAAAVVQSARRAEQQAQAAARRLLQQAEQSFQPDKSPNTALRLALAARKAHALPEVDDFLRKALAVMPAAEYVLPSLRDTAADAWWSVHALSFAEDGRSTIALFEDGRRDVKLVALPQTPAGAASEIVHQLPKGWIGAVAPYGASIVFQPEPEDDGGGLAGPGGGPDAAVLQLPSLRETARFSMTGRGPLTVGVDPDGRYLALGRDRELELWQLAPRQRLGHWRMPETDPSGTRWTGWSRLLVHPTGKLLTFVPSSSRTGYAPVWALDTRTGDLRPIAVFQDSPRAIAFDRGGRHFAAGDRYGSVRLFDVDTDAGAFVESTRLALSPDGIGVNDLALSEDGSLIAVVIRNVQVFDIRSGRRTALIDGNGPFLFAERGNVLWTGDDVKAGARGRHGMVTRWRLSSASEHRRVLTSRHMTDAVTAFDFVPGTHDLLAAADRRELLHLHAESGELLHRWPVSAEFFMSKAAAVPASRVVRFPSAVGGVQAGADGVTQLPKAPGAPADSAMLEISADARRALSYSIRVDGTTKHARFTSIDVEAGRVDSSLELAGVDADMTRIPIVGWDWVVMPVDRPGDSKSARSCVRLDVRDARKLQTTVSSLPCMPDEDSIGLVDRSGRLVLASKERVQILSLPELRLLSSFKRDSDSLDAFPDAIALSAGEKFLALLDRSKVVTVFGLDGVSLARFPVERDSFTSLNALRFSNDGQWLAANVGWTDGRGSIYMWDWSPETLLAQACERLAGTAASVEYVPVLRGVDSGAACLASSVTTSKGAQR